MDILGIILCDKYLSSNLYLDNTKCAEEIGAPAHCIFPFRDFIQSFNEGKGGSCPMPSWGTELFKELKNIKEKCVGKGGKIYFYNIQTSYNFRGELNYICKTLTM